MKRAFIYTRTSTGEQVLGHHAQEQECRAHASRQGLNVVDVVSENVSASSPPTERAGFSALIERLEKGDAVFMWRRDRLGRSPLDNAVAESIIRSRGASLITGDVSADDTAESTMMKVMLDAIAQYEKALIIQRTRAALAAKKARGEALGNTALGHSKEAGRLIEDTAEKEKIERVRAWRAQSYSLTRIQEMCAQNHISARGSDAPPSISTLSRWCEPIMPPEAPEVAPPRYPLTERLTKPTLEATRPGLSESCRDLQTQGLTIRQIADEIEKRGYRNSRGNPLSHVQIHRILKR